MVTLNYSFVVTISPSVGMHPVQVLLLYQGTVIPSDVRQYSPTVSSKPGLHLSTNDLEYEVYYPVWKFSSLAIAVVLRSFAHVSVTFAIKSPVR